MGRQLLHALASTPRGSKEMSRVGQNHTFTGIYGVYIWYFWQGNHHTYNRIRCVYMVLANPRNEQSNNTGGRICAGRESHSSFRGDSSLEKHALC